MSQREGVLNRFLRYGFAKEAWLLNHNYEIGEKLGLSDEEEAVMKSYLAYYRVRQKTQELSYMLNRPEVEAMEATPILASIARAMISFGNRLESTADGFMKDANNVGLSQSRARQLMMVSNMISSVCMNIGPRKSEVIKARVDKITSETMSDWKKRES